MSLRKEQSTRLRAPITCLATVPLALGISTATRGGMLCSHTDK
jgi:hypothetical protein